MTRSEWESFEYLPNDPRLSSVDFWDAKKNNIMDNWMTGKAVRKFNHEDNSDESLIWKMGETMSWEVNFGTGQHETILWDAKMWHGTGSMDLILTDGAAFLGVTTVSAALALTLF